MIAQCRPDVRLEKMQGFVVQGPHHENASILVEGLGVRGRAAAGQSRVTRRAWSVVHPTPARAWTLGVDGMLPPAVNKDGPTETGASS